MAFMPRSASASLCLAGQWPRGPLRCVFRLSAQARVQTRWHQNQWSSKKTLSRVARVRCKLAALKQEGQGVMLPSAGVARPSRRLKKRVLRGSMELAAYKDTRDA